MAINFLTAVILEVSLVSITAIMGKTYETVSLEAGSAARTFSPPRVYFPDNRLIRMSWRIKSVVTRGQLYIRTLSSNLDYLGHVCGTDINYMEAFDGYNNSSPSLGIWCGEERVEKQASGRFMYVHMYARYFSKDVYFKIEYRSIPTEEIHFEDSSGSLSVAQIAGISVGVLAIVCGASIVIRILCSRYKSSENSRLSADNVEETTGRQSLFQDNHGQLSPAAAATTTQTFRVSPSAPPFSDHVEMSPPPPSYEEVVRTLQ